MLKLKKKLFLSFSYCKYNYALPISFIKEVIYIKKNQLTWLPNFNQGLINFDNKIIPIFKLKKIQNNNINEKNNQLFVRKNTLMLAILKKKLKLFGIIIKPNIEIIKIRKIFTLKEILIKEFKKKYISYIAEDRDKKKIFIPNLNYYCKMQIKSKK